MTLIYYAVMAGEGRPSTTFCVEAGKVVDGGDKPGHDAAGAAEGVLTQSLFIES